MRLINVKVSVIFAVVLTAVAYTNCSKVAFDTPDVEATSQALGFKDGALIQIDDGATYTKSEDVSLRLEHDDAEQMLISDQPNCSAGSWEPMARKKVWKLAEKNQKVIVYARYRRFFGEKWIESDCVSDAIIHDSIAPVVDIRRPAGNLFNAASLDLELIATDSGSGIEDLRCVAVGAMQAACQPGRSMLNLPEGLHSIKVSAVDRAGNISESIEDSLTIDRTAPSLRWNSTPSAITADTAGKFSFTATDAVSGVAGFECRVGAGAFAACTNPYSGSFSAGRNTFSVRAIDVAGNLSQELVYNWMIDLSAPTVRITSAPDANTNSVTAQFVFSGSDEGVAITNFRCRLDGAAAVNCSSPLNYSSLSEGSHNFSVVGIDSAGNESAPAIHNWFIDKTAPQVRLVSVPDRRTSMQSAQFGFSAVDAGSGVKDILCSINGGGFSKCVSPSTYLNLSEGNQSFQIKAVDLVGNVSSTLQHVWFVDRVKPEVMITAGPAAVINVTTANLQFVATDADGGTISSLECRLDAGNWEACVSPKIFEDLARGDHRFEVRATDSVGLVSDIKDLAFKVEIMDPVVICDPFGTTTVTKPGIAARLTYYDGAAPSDAIRSVNDLFTKGTKVEDTVILFSAVSVPTRSFSQGFDIGGGQKLQNSRGETLIEWFGLDYTSEIKLADADSEGLYQFGTLSDDGTILWLDTGAGLSTVVNNDGQTATRMKCGSAVQINRGDRIPMRLKYFQGPRTEIAVNLLWRKVSANMNMNPSYCNTTGFFTNGQPNDRFRSMEADGWKVIPAVNFQMVEVIPNKCS